MGGSGHCTKWKAVDQLLINCPRAMTGRCTSNRGISFDCSRRRASPLFWQTNFAVSSLLAQYFTGCTKQAVQQWRCGWPSARSQESQIRSLGRYSSRGNLSWFRSRPKTSRPNLPERFRLSPNRERQNQSYGRLEAPVWPMRTARHSKRSCGAIRWGRSP